MKLNKDRFLENIYCWGIREDSYTFNIGVTFYRNKKRGENINNSGFLYQIYEEFSFDEFFEARETLQKYNKKLSNKYKMWYEKKVF